MFADAMPDKALSLFLRPIPPLYSAYQQQADLSSGWIKIKTFHQQPLNAEAAIGEQMLEEMARLPDNWDGYGGLPISKGAVANARAALSSLLAAVPLPDITPNPNGTISMEWETERGVAHLEVGATRFSFFLQPRVGGSTYAAGLASSIPVQSLGALIASALFSIEASQLAVTSYRFAIGHV